MKTYRIGYIDMYKPYLNYDMCLLQEQFPDLKIEIIDDCYNNECDLIFYTTLVPGDYIYSIDKYISNFCDQILNKFPHTKFCLLHGEPHGFPHKDGIVKTTINTFVDMKLNNYSISHFIDSTTNCFYPYIVGEFSSIQNYDCCLKDFIDIKINKDIFCSIISSTECIHRRKYINIISKYKNVEVYGSLGNNKLSDYEAEYKFNSSKFNLAIENSESIKDEFYITEKIAKSYKHGCIPIYFGTDYVYEIFNDKTFIDTNKYNDDELIEYIKEIDTNDNLYNEIINTHIFKDINKNYFHYFKSKMNSFIKNILEDKI